MSSAKKRASDKIKKHLFKPTSEVSEKLTELELERKKRIMLAVSRKLDDPIMPDRELIAFLTSGCDGTIVPVSQSTAYRDLKLINDITGNIRLASKDWERYMVVETAKDQVKKFKDKDGRAVAALLKVIVQARQLDRDDPEHYFEQMIPFEPIITSDPEILGDGIQRIPNVEARRNELRQYFNKHSSTTYFDNEEQQEERG